MEGVLRKGLTRPETPLCTQMDRAREVPLAIGHCGGTKSPETIPYSRDPVIALGITERRDRAHRTFRQSSFLGMRCRSRVGDI
jgi:hypothetical protein